MEATDQQTKLLDATKRTDEATGKLATHAKSVAGSFLSVAKWLTIGGGLAGVATGVGLFGMDRLAHGVFAQRRFAQGVGVRTGEEAAFRVDYGSLVDPDGMLSRIADARNDLNQQYAFRQLRISADQESGLDNAGLAQEVIRRSRDIWLHGPHTEQYARSMGLLQFSSMDDLRRYGDTSDADMARKRSDYRKDQKDFDVSDDVQRQWIQLDRQLMRAGSQITTTFVTDLALLTPGLMGLSDGVAHAIDSFMGAPGIKTAIKNLGDWLGDESTQKAIHDFGDFLGSKKFQNDLSAFEDGIGVLAHKIAIALRWLHWIPDDTNDKTNPEPARVTPHQNEEIYKDTQRKNALPPSPEWLKTAPSLGAGSPQDQAAMRQELAKNSSVYSVPYAFMENLWGAESSYSKDLATSRTGARGPMQFEHGTAQEFGVTNPYDNGQAAKGASAYVRTLLDHFGFYQTDSLSESVDDLKKAAAAYDWGQGRVDRDIKAHGRDWEKYVPKETEQEIRRAVPMNDTMVKAVIALKKAVATGQRLQVTVTNDTSARVAVTANQVAPQ